VQKAVNFQIPDRVPIDLGGMKASGIAATAYARLKKLAGLGSPTRELDPRFMITAVAQEVLRAVRGDVLPVDLSGILSAVRCWAGASASASWACA
jgi:uroporphyrinogen decarboxylase